MKEGYVNINHVPTHVMTWGHWIEDKFDDEIKQIVVLVVGNPGNFCDIL